MVLKRSRGYEDIDGQSAPAAVHNDTPRNEPAPPQEIEMASVSVVPDGIASLLLISVEFTEKFF